MIPACVVCHNDSQSLSDVRGVDHFERSVVESLTVSGSQIDRNAPMLACFSCIARILDSQAEDQTLSIPNLLRNAASIEDQAAVSISSSGSGSTERADADEGDVTSSSTSDVVTSSQIARVLSEDVVGAVHSQSTLPLPPADPRLLPRYNEILNQAMPLKAKKRRLDELINNAQEPEISSASGSADESESIRRGILKMAKRSRQRRNGSSSSSSSSQPLSQPSQAGQPSRTIAIIRMGSSSNSQPMLPPPSRRPGPLSRRSPQQPLLPAHRTPPSSLSSNEERLGNESSNDSLSVSGHQAPSLPNSPPLPSAVRPRDDSNGHTNAGAPRRISQQRSSSPQTRANARQVTSKNLGG